jgi:hypothetical protein
MYYRDPNKPRPGASHPDPEPRHLEQPGYGSAARDGYTCTGRRPRAPGYSDIVSPEEADRMEGIFSDMPPFGHPFGY